MSFRDCSGNLMELKYAGRTEEELIQFLEQNNIDTLYYYVGGWKMVDSDGNDVKYDPSYSQSGATSNTITGTAVAFTSDTLAEMSVESFKAKLESGTIRATAAQKKVTGTVSGSSANMNGGTMRTSGTLTYSIEVLNTTRETATITVTDYIPSHTTYAANSVTVTDPSGSTYSGNYSCQLYTSTGAAISEGDAAFSAANVAYIVWTITDVSYDKDAALSFICSFDVTCDNPGNDTESLVPVTNSASLTLSFTSDGESTVWTPTTNTTTTYRTRAENEVKAGDVEVNSLGQYYVAAGAEKITFLDDLNTKKDENPSGTDGEVLDPEWNYDENGEYTKPTDVTSYLGNNGYLVVSLPGVTLDIEKIAEGTGTNLTGAEFYLYYMDTANDGTQTTYYYTYTASEDSSGNTVYEAGWSTNENEKYTLSTGTDTYQSMWVYGLQPGTYYLAESKAPEGYLGLSSVTITVGSDGSVSMTYGSTTYTTGNTSGNTNTWKVETASKETYVQATEYVLGTTYYTLSNNTYTEATGVTASNFESGTYYVKETMYYYILTIPNSEAEINLEIDKVSASDGSKQLTGAEFILYKTAGEGDDAKTTYYSYTAGADGGSGTVSWVESKESATKLSTGSSAYQTISVYGLTPGTYYLEEVAAPAGYDPLTGVITITVADDGTVSVTYGNTTYNSSTGDASGWKVGKKEDSDDTWVIAVPNSNGERLPETGGLGTSLLYGLAMLLILGASGGLIVKRKRTGYGAGRR